MVSFCILPLLSICRDKLNCMKVSGRFADQYSAPEPFVGSIRSRCTRHCFLLQNFLFVNIDTVNIDNIDASGHCQDLFVNPNCFAADVALVVDPLLAR